jgi:hypothetical protein
MKTKPEKISIVTQWYLPKQINRLQEMERALKLNCNNPFVGKIVLLNEEIYELPINHEKIIQVDIGKRLTFGDAYKYSCRNSETGEAWCLANSDIAFDETLGDIYFSNAKEVYCLTRYDMSDGKWDLFSEHGIPRADSQDAWIFLTSQTPLKPCPFTGLSAEQLEIGQLGFDNKIALIFHVSGFICNNPCKTIKSYHYHFQRDMEHDSTREIFRIPFPYLLLDAVKMGEESRLELNVLVQTTMPATSFNKIDRIRLSVLPTDNLEALQLRVDARIFRPNQ